jgi:hypothetical protein
MTDVLERARATLTAFLSEAGTALGAAFARLGPLEWGALLAALLLLILVALLVRARRSDPNQGRPEVLISLGAITASEGFDEEGGVMLPKRYRLKMTVSNLNTYPMQALELALKTPEMALPITVELAAIIPPEGSVVIDEMLPEITGDEGKLNLYLYAANRSGRTYRLQTAFALEPWNERYKISPLGQSVAVTRQLASTGVSRVQERAWREREGRRPSISADSSGWRAPLRRERKPTARRREHAGAERGVGVYEAPEEPRLEEALRGERMSFPDEF